MSKAEEKAGKACPINKGSGIDRVISMINRKNGYIQGYRQAEKDLGWHSVDECLPEMDEEVIVLTDIIVENSISIGLGKIGFAHLVNPDATITIDGKPYKPESHNGWNIPRVRYWMPCPKIPEE